MTPEIRELDVLELWRRPPGTLDRWARWVIGCACLVTIALAAIGPRVLWLQCWAPANYTAHRGIDHDLFCNGLAIGASLWVLASLVPRWRLSRYVRVAMLLPIAHLLLIATAWPIWCLLAPRMPSIIEWSTLVEDVPLGVTVAVLAIVVVGLAWLIGRGRREWSHAFVMLALVNFLLVGLWVPIACWIRSRGSTLDWWSDPELTLRHPFGIVVTALVPPLAGAAAYTMLAIRHPEVARRHRTTAIGFVIALLGTSLVVRSKASPAACVVYANMIPILLATMLVTIGAIVGLGMTTWWRARSSRQQLARELGVEGVIIEDDPHEPIVACLEIAGWLRGPRSHVRSFVVATSAGRLPIRSARLAAPIDATTTQIRVGEAVPVLRVGDRVTITGLDLADPGDPFRTLAGPIAGVGVTVAPHDPGPYGMADVALAMWRPSIAYLVILVAVACPALAALVAVR